MDIHKLHIFAKNRDAVAPQKGYTFQQLKTAREWLEQRIAGSTDVIYCDYEDDIFSRNIEHGKSTFRQIKLFSTDFSFASDSIRKSIAHFFMLYVKGEYAFDKTTFSFETNASVVGKDFRDNDADLLREWHGNQEKLTDELIARIRVRVRKILEEYIVERYADLSKDTTLKGDVQKAKAVYDGLRDDDIDAFIRCIKWQFDGIEQNQAIEQMVADIESLITNLPLPLEQGREHIYGALVITEVHARSVQDDPEDRKLTGEQLDRILLGAGNKEDQWYAEALEQDKNAGKVTAFFPGKFQTVINGARYCRWKTLDQLHKVAWLESLGQYISLTETPVENKRKGIYEYLFLKIGHNPLEKRTESAIKDDIDLVKFYFDNWENRNLLLDIEEDITLLQLLKAQHNLYGLPVAKEDLFKWEEKIQNYLDEGIKAEVNIDRNCELLELRGHLENQKNAFTADQNPEAAFAFYRKILPLLGKTKFYTLARLYSQMDSFRDLLIRFDAGEELQDAIDVFMSEIQPYAEKRGLQHNVAMDLVKRSERHLKNHNLRNTLKALELLHQAKDKWRYDNTKGVYILMLLQISRVYESLGMTYASKYYAMIALWGTWNSADPRLFKLLSQSVGLINMNDFLSGAWFNATRDFGFFYAVKREFDEKGFDFSGDRLYQNALVNMAIIAHAAPKMNGELTPYIKEVQERLGPIWEQQVKPIYERISNENPTIETIKENLKKILRDRPLNDVGAKRKIKFNALGIDWNMEFDNNGIMTAIGESFASFVHVMLCEIAHYGSNVLVSGKQVEISVEQGQFFDKKDLGNGRWVITIPVFDSNEQAEIQNHYMYLGSLAVSVIGSITTLSKEELQKFYIHLLKDKKLGDKVLEGTAYQRAFKQTLDFSSLGVVSGSDFKATPGGDDFVDYRNQLVDF